MKNQKAKGKNKEEGVTPIFFFIFAFCLLPFDFCLLIFLLVPLPRNQPHIPQHPGRQRLQVLHILRFEAHTVT